MRYIVANRKNLKANSRDLLGNICDENDLLATSNVVLPY